MRGPTLTDQQHLDITAGDSPCFDAACVCCQMHIEVCRKVEDRNEELEALVRELAGHDANQLRQEQWFTIAGLVDRARELTQ